MCRLRKEGDKRRRDREGGAREEESEQEERGADGRAGEERRDKPEYIVLNVLVCERKEGEKGGEVSAQRVDGGGKEARDDRLTTN